MGLRSLDDVGARGFSNPFPYSYPLSRIRDRIRKLHFYSLKCRLDRIAQHNGPTEITSEVAKWLSSMQGTKTKSTTNCSWLELISNRCSAMRDIRVQIVPSMQFNAPM